MEVTGRACGYVFLECFPTGIWLKFWEKRSWARSQQLFQRAEPARSTCSSPAWASRLPAELQKPRGLGRGIFKQPWPGRLCRSAAFSCYLFLQLWSDLETAILRLSSLQLRDVQLTVTLLAGHSAASFITVWGAQQISPSLLQIAPNARLFWKGVGVLSIVPTNLDNNSNTMWWSAVNATRLSLVTKTAACGSLLKRESQQGWQQPARAQPGKDVLCCSALLPDWCSPDASISWHAVACRDTESMAPGLRSCFGRDASLSQAGPAPAACLPFCVSSLPPESMCCLEGGLVQWIPNLGTSGC